MGSLHYTPEHCLVNGRFPLFWWKKPCLRSPAEMGVCLKGNPEGRHRLRGLPSLTKQPQRLCTLTKLEDAQSPLKGSRLNRFCARPSPMVGGRSVAIRSRTLPKYELLIRAFGVPPEAKVLQLKNSCRSFGETHAEESSPLVCPLAKLLADVVHPRNPRLPDEVHRKHRRLAADWRISETLK